MYSGHLLINWIDMKGDIVMNSMYLRATIACMRKQKIGDTQQQTQKQDVHYCLSEMNPLGP